VTTLLPDSRFRKAEQGVQHMFSKSSFFSYLALIALTAGAHVWLRSMPNRSDAPERSAEVRFTPLRLDRSGFAPLGLAGAWRVEVADPRFGGLSALAIDGGKLLAVTDSGSIAWLPRPGEGGRAIIRDLPAGPGNAAFKHNRDSEALVRDPRGRGWWVAFERWNQLWLYDPSFRRPLGKRDLGVRRWPANRGVEGLATADGGLILFPEAGDEWLVAGEGRISRHKLTNSFGSVADTLNLPSGRLLLVTRQVTAGGLAKRIVEAVPKADGNIELRQVASLPLGATDNVEGIAAERRADGGTRLWLVTDDDFRPRKATLLLALDLP
jgi:hypothetical protein